MTHSFAFERAMEFVLPHEEEFARGHWGDETFVVTENVAGDSGGLTKYGIDAASHPGVDIAGLTKEKAVAIYYGEWERHELDAIPDKLAIAAFDVWVNGGHANLWLQRAYNKTAQGDQLAEDGILGPLTINRLWSADESKIVEAFLKERDTRFEALAANGKQKFLAGWLQRDKDLEAFLLG